MVGAPDRLYRGSCICQSGGCPISSSTQLPGGPKGSPDCVLVRAIGQRKGRPRAPSPKGRLGAGYEVLPATNGMEALELAAAARPAVDAVITDLQMPQMGGEALERAMSARGQQ